MNDFLIINGPNLNLLGIREPKIYGNQNFDEYVEQMNSKLVGIKIEYFQSNIEGEIIDKLHEVGFHFDGIILNAAAYTHTSVAIGDAVASIKSTVIEVHLSNTYAREDFRHKSYISPHAKGIVLGFGLKSYELALSSLI